MKPDPFELLEAVNLKLLIFNLNTLHLFITASAADLQ